MSALCTRPSTCRDLYKAMSSMKTVPCPDGEALEEVNQRITEITRTAAHPANAGQKLLKPAKKDAERNWSFDQFKDEFANKALDTGKEQAVNNKDQQEESSNE